MKERIFQMSVMNKIALALVIIGALNWGLVGLFTFDLVAWIFGAGSVMARIVYTLVALSGLWCFGLLFDSPAHDRVTQA